MRITFALLSFLIGAALAAGYFYLDSQNLSREEALKRGGNVILMRHAEPIEGVGDIDGSCEGRLTQAGMRHARETGMNLSSLRIARIFTSPLCRARTTADLVSEGLGIKSEVMHALSDNACNMFSLEKMIARWGGDKNIILVTHGSVATLLTGRTLSKGEWVVLRRNRWPQPGYRVIW